MRDYKCLSKQTYSLNEYQIVPIRDQDKYDIMQWRNEQMYHLRQSKPLDKDSQDKYFNTVIKKLFETENPDQMLFSYLKNGVCMGYGGLVRINWVDKNAELSFIINTAEEAYFNLHWSTFLGLIQKLAFEEMKFHKIYTYAFDLRPHLYKVLEENDFRKEAMLKEHCFYNGKYINVIIHSKIK